MSHVSSSTSPFEVVLNDGSHDPARRFVFWASVGVVALWAVGGLDPVEPGELINDLGIQFHLSAETLRGAIPIRDFEHGWNALGWYIGAGLHALVGGNETLWVFVWEQVTGTFLAGTAALLVARRARLPAGWMLGLLATWLALTSIPHGKYAIPSLWLLAFLPAVSATEPPAERPTRAGRRTLHGALAGRSVRPTTELAVRGVVGGVTLLLHIELAVMLAAGLALYDLVGARDVAVSRRVIRALAAPLGMVAAFGVELAFYAAVGVGPGELVDFLLLERSTTNSTNFGYPLLEPRSFLQIVYPASLVLAFVPTVWRRLGPVTRLTACLHVAMGLIAIRKSDLQHVEAATTLLAVLVVLVAHDLWTTRSRAGEDTGRASAGPVRRAFGGLAGAATFAFAVLVPFLWDSLFAVVVLVAACGLVAVIARGGRYAAASVGAFVAAGVLVVTASVGRTVSAADVSDTRAEDIAAAVADELDGCLDDERRAWIVGGPLELYTTLAVDNPTPFYLFWQGFSREEERVEALMRDGEIPTIVKVNRFPNSFESMRDVLEREYEACLDTDVAATGDAVTVFTRPGIGESGSSS